VNFWRPTPSALLALGLRSSTDIPALKELEEWFDSQKEIRGIAKLDPFFERTSKLASRRLKCEIERRRTLGQFALEPNPLHLKRIPSKESCSDLFRSDGPDAVGGVWRSRVAAKRCAGLPGSRRRRARGKGVLTGSIGEICGRAAAGPAWPSALSRHARSAKEIAKYGSSIAVSHRSTSRSSILRQFSGHFRGVPLADAAHRAAISPKFRRVAMEGFFTERISFASL
jgi:hypothetical protein